MTSAILEEIAMSGRTAVSHVRGMVKVDGHLSYMGMRLKVDNALPDGVVVVITSHWGGLAQDIIVVAP